MQTADIDPKDLTKYKWGFTKKLSEEESFKLDSMRDKVARDTKITNLGPTKPGGVSNRGPLSSLADRDAAAQINYENRIARERAERKRFKIQQKATLDELVPKPDPGSAAARREKRAAKGAYARKSDDVEDFTGGVDAMGGGDDELQRLLAKNQRRTDRRQESRREHADKLLGSMQEKEAAIKNQFVNLLGSQTVDPRTGRAMVRPRQ
eukprot:CAMPEP_0168591488 /NCGR_PEP_ID=MMETSP0420-20121227/7166_1 /TAXON_ID=498008 /ORGANISM="Pessonella sp." /LENGTH=207 /DNA_ID=CAMNT_0008627293 /DNA_START=403 /DNA_END=1026 /DNA_ORIENTATION=+